MSHNKFATSCQFVYSRTQFGVRLKIGIKEWEAAGFLLHWNLQEVKEEDACELVTIIIHL